MNNDSGSNVSLWVATGEVAEQPQLKMDDVADADVCVVGAGITGLSVAYTLLQHGKSVIVLDDGPVGGGETGRTTAHLSNALDDRYYNLERLHGAEGARLAAESHTAAIDTIERIVEKERIDCDFQRLDGYLFAAPGRPEDELERELTAARKAGLTQVERLPRAPLADFDTGPCLRFPNLAQFHAIRYLDGLVHAIKNMGGRFFTNTHVNEFHGGQGAYVKTRTGARVSAGAIVVATNSPVNNRVVMHLKQAAYRSYVIGARIPKGAVTAALFWDTGDPYHYVRLAPSDSPAYDYLIVGGEDHKTGQEDDAEVRYAALERWSRERFPAMGEVDYRWSGQVMEPVDGLAFIGKNPKDEANIYIATGDSGHGITHGTIAGLLLTDLILDRPNPWKEVYDPSRRRLGAAWEFTREGVNTFAQYKDHLTGGEVDSVDQIGPGTGAVMRRGVHKIAVFRDEQGKLHECSATCSHLAGIVHWNHDEQTWDCPCHGSRFDPYGKVLNGPAIGPLARAPGSLEAAAKKEE